MIYVIFHRIIGLVIEHDNGLNHGWMLVLTGCLCLEALTAVFAFNVSTDDDPQSPTNSWAMTQTIL